MANSHQTALLLIDMQQGLDDPYWGKRNNPEAEQNAAQILSYWRQCQWPVIHVRHASTEPNSPLRPELPGFAYKPETAPIESETCFEKNVNSGFIGTGLEQHLRDNEIHDLVILGLTTDHCVSTTTRMAGNLGFNVILLSDATATFERTGINGDKISADDMHRIHLASLNNEFCVVRTTQEVINQFS